MLPKIIIKTRSITPEDAHKFLCGDDWPQATCARCSASLEHGGGSRPSKGDPLTRRDAALSQLAERGATEGERAAAQAALGVDILCHGCIYVHDAAEFRQSGILSGSSLLTSALLRHDWEIYRPFFDAECMLTPTIQAVWERYKAHPTLTDPRVKRALLINPETGITYSRKYEESFADLLREQHSVRTGSIVIEIFDAMCGYVGIEIYRFKRSTHEHSPPPVEHREVENGMWVQGQIRESGASACYRSCYADKAFLNEVNAAVRGLLIRNKPGVSEPFLPIGYSLYEYGVRLPVGLFGTIHLFGDELKDAPAKAWEHAEKNVQAYLSRCYGVPEFQPGWIEGSGYSPMSDMAVSEYRLNYPGR